MRHWKQDRIGQKFVDRLDEVAITIGSDSFTRQDLVEKKKGVTPTANFIAAAILGEKLKKHFKPKNVKDLSGRIDLFMLREIDGIGDTAVMVWCCLLEKKGLSVDRWLDQDFTEVNERRRAWIARKRKVARSRAA